MKISVIITTFQRNNLLTEAINSVLNQEFKDYELIIVDDGSSDTSIHEYSCINSKIRYIYSSNCGISTARNIGMQAARSDLIAFLDADDVWLPEKLLVQYDFFQKHPESKICYTDSVWIRHKKCVNPPRNYLPRGGWIWNELLSCCFMGASTVMLRRDLCNEIGFFDETLPVCEDYDFWLRIAQKHPIDFIDKALVKKRMGEWNQLSTAYWGMDRFRISSLEKILNSNCLNPEQIKKAKKAINEKSYILAKGCWKHKRYFYSTKYTLKWLRHALGYYNKKMTII